MTKTDLPFLFIKEVGVTSRTRIALASVRVVQTHIVDMGAEALGLDLLTTELTHAVLLAKEPRLLPRFRAGK